MTRLDASARKLDCVPRAIAYALIVNVAAACLALAQAPPDGPAKSADDPDSSPTLAPPVAWLLEPVEIPDASAAAESEMKPYKEKLAGMDVVFEMVPIPGGTFVMGSPTDEPDRGEDEGPQFKVKLEPFWMGKCEVTWDEYEQWAMGLDQQFRKITRASSTKYDDLADAITMPTKPYADMTFGMGKDKYPAICMTQLAAKLYCKWLSAKTGRYYRLPTEAEWEYACRAGTASAYGFGDDPDQLDDYGWYYDNGDDQYHEVGQKQPNVWGLYDMHGNVCEWVLDMHTPDGYRPTGETPVDSPLVAPEKIYSRVVRGGSWLDDPEMLRSAARMASDPDWKRQDPQIPRSIWYYTDADFVGFRVVRPLQKPTVAEAARYDVDKIQKDSMAEYAEARGTGL